MSGSTGTSPVVTTLTVDDANFRESLANAANLLQGYVRTNESAARAIAASNQTHDQASTSMRNFGGIVGQAGYQLQDFAVQVQAGTSAMTALSQQGSQFLGAFGTGGAIAGAVLTVGILAAKFFETQSATEAAKRSADNYALAVEKLRDLLESAAQKANRLRNVGIEAGMAAARQLGEAGTRRGEDLGEQILRQQEVVQRMEAQLNAIPEGSRTGLRASAIQRNLDDARNKLRSLQGDSEIASAEVREAMRLQRQFQEQLDRGNVPEGKPKPDNSTPRTPAGRAPARVVDQAARDGATLQNSFDNFWDNLELQGERAASRFENNTNRARQATEDLSGVGKEFGTVFTSAFDGMITKGMKFADVLTRLEQGIARIIERQFITKPLESAISKLFEGTTPSGLLSGIGDWFTGLFRAEGGPVTGGSPYIVGEQGPELFVPNHGGTIIPNSAMGGAGGMSIAIDARGADPGAAARIDAVLSRRLPAILAAAHANTVSKVQRGGSDAQIFGRRGR